MGFFHLSEIWLRLTGSKRCYYFPEACCIVGWKIWKGIWEHGKVRFFDNFLTRLNNFKFSPESPLFLLLPRTRSKMKGKTGDRGEGEQWERRRRRRSIRKYRPDPDIANTSHLFGWINYICWVPINTLWSPRGHYATYRHSEAAPSFVYRPTWAQLLWHAGVVH